jgi:NOL1/NOP2/fmu family ribosome biogenesis protein
LVLTSEVKVHSGQFEIESSGMVVPFRDITMSAEVAGRITEKSAACKAGNFVKAGTKLIEIDRQEYELEVERAEAELKQAKSQAQELRDEIRGGKELLQVARNDEKIQQEELDRLEALSAVVSSAEVNQARRALLASQNSVLNQTTQLELLETKVDRLQSGIALAESRLKTSKLNRDRATIVAPSDGVIVRELAQQDDFVQRGTPLFEFEDISQAEVKINLRPDDLQKILDSQPVASESADPSVQPGSNPYALPSIAAEIIYAVDGQTSVWHGVLSRYDGGGLDERTRTVPVRIKVEDRRSNGASGNSVRSIVRNMPVKVKLKLTSQTRLLQVPGLAVNAGDIVWTVKEGKLKRHRVNVVGVDASVNSDQDDDASAQFIFVDESNAPQPGDAVVVSPLIMPIDGQLVRTQPAVGILKAPDKEESNQPTENMETQTTETDAKEKTEPGKVLSSARDDSLQQNRNDAEKDLPAHLPDQPTTPSAKTEPIETEPIETESNITEPVDADQIQAESPRTPEALTETKDPVGDESSEAQETKEETPQPKQTPINRRTT